MYNKIVSYNKKKYQIYNKIYNEIIYYINYVSDYMCTYTYINNKSKQNNTNNKTMFINLQLICKYCNISGYISITYHSYSINDKC